ncbi:hypothetical protein JCM33374_g1441 [Metschnikowia sp. JCM 33374]|nr:hypothetical protein JCM33374_g1441 [Metschnikowia sp. JCM 33374]
MKLSSLLPFFALASAYDILRAGMMYVSKLDGIPTRKNLISQGVRLVVATEGSRFDYDKRGSLKLTGSGRYLSVNEAGKLVFIDEPDTEFFLTREGSSRSRKRLSYKGNTIFQMCGDDSIGFKSDCEDARNVLITYEDINYQM